MTDRRPLYYVIEKDLKDKIERGEYKPGDVLPTESELCEQYQVSRITVRKAVSRLEEEGIIDHPFSKTPSVKKNAIPRQTNSMRGLTEDLAQAGIRCSNYILKAEEQEADESIAQKMGIEVKEKLYYIERLRYGNGDPLCYQAIYLVAKYCPGLLDADLSKTSLYGVLENQYKMKIANCKQSITACMSSYRLCALLELKERTAMLKVTNIGYLKSGECYEYSQNYYIGGTYTISVELSRN